MKNVRNVNEYEKKHVTRARNIVTDGWARASNPNDGPIQTQTPTPHTNVQKEINETLIFPLFDSIITDGRTDGRIKPLIDLRVRNKKQETNGQRDVHHRSYRKFDTVQFHVASFHC